MVQKIHTFLCLKIRPEVGKVLNRDKEGNVADGTMKILKKVVFWFLLKNYKSYQHEIWLHTGKKNAESIYNVKKKKKNLIIVQS